MGFWPGLQYQIWIPSCESCFKSNHRAVGYPLQLRHYCISGHIFFGRFIAIVQRFQSCVRLLMAFLFEQHELGLWKLTNKEAASNWIPSRLLCLHQQMYVEYSAIEFHYPVLVGNYEQKNRFYYSVWISVTSFIRNYPKDFPRILSDPPRLLGLAWSTHMKSQMWIDGALKLEEHDKLSFYAWNKNKFSLLKQQSFFSLNSTHINL